MFKENKKSLKNLVSEKEPRDIAFVTFNIQIRRAT